MHEIMTYRTEIYFVSRDKKGTLDYFVKMGDEYNNLKGKTLLK